jgi:hypothetical protein
MKAGRKNLQRACQDGTAVTLAEGESIMQVVTLRGSNLIEVRTRPSPGLRTSQNPLCAAAAGFLTRSPASVRRC